MPIHYCQHGNDIRNECPSCGPAPTFQVDDDVIVMANQGGLQHPFKIGTIGKVVEIRMWPDWGTLIQVYASDHTNKTTWWVSPHDIQHLVSEDEVNDALNSIKQAITRSDSE